MSTVATYTPQAGPPPAPELAPASYLTDPQGWRSWMFTTDHKRIAILYMITVTLFFFVGGAAATIIRLNLITPRGASSPPRRTTSCSPPTASSWSGSS